MAAGTALGSSGGCAFRVNGSPEMNVVMFHPCAAHAASWLVAETCGAGSFQPEGSFPSRVGGGSARAPEMWGISITGVQEVQQGCCNVRDLKFNEQLL